MSDPVYSLITDLDGNGPCMGLPSWSSPPRLVAMITPCPFADKDVVPDSVEHNSGSEISYGNGFIKLTRTGGYCQGKIIFRLKHNGENRTIKITKNANSRLFSTFYVLQVNNLNFEGYREYAMHIGDNIVVPPYYRYRIVVSLGVERLSGEWDDTEIWVKAEIF